MRPATTRTNTAKAALALVTTLTATLLPAFAAPPASAKAGFDLYNLHGANLHIHSTDCRNVIVTAETSADPSNVTDVSAEVDVWIHGSLSTTVYLEEHPGVNNLRGTFQYCPYLDGPGTYRLGDTQVTWYDQDYNEHSRIDHSRGTMAIKQSSRARLTTPRSHPRMIYVAPQYYANTYGWYHFPRGIHLNLQRQPRHSRAGAPWHRVSTHLAGRLGRSSWRIPSNGHHYRYRVTAGSGWTWTWPLYSRVVIK